MNKLITNALAFVALFSISACQSKKDSPEGHAPHIHSDGSAHYH